MSSKQKDSSRLSIVLAPQAEIGGQLERAAAEWIREGILTDFIWVPTDGLTADGIRQMRLSCSFASKSEGRQEFDLFQYLSQVVVEHVDVIIPWALGDGHGDDDLWRIGSALRAALKEGMPNGGSGASVRSKWLYTTLLVMPTTDRAQAGFEPTSGEYGEFDLNVYVSPETRSNPWAGSAPLHSGEDFELFALGQLATVAGAWAGSTESLTGLLDRKGYRFGQGSFVMMRTMASMVVTNGLAERLVSESLRQLTDTNRSPYELSDPNDLNRPVARAEEMPLIKEQIDLRVDKVLRVGGDELTYESERKPEALDFSRDWKEAIRFFWQFTRDTVKAMPRYSLDYLKNEWSRLVGRKLTDVREAVPERFIGITEELKQMLRDIEDFRNNDAAQDSLVISARAESKNPKIWSALRAVAIGAVDGSDTPQGEKPVVLPRIDYVVHDPTATFHVNASMVEMFELADERVDFGQASELKGRVAGALAATNDHLDELNQAIAVIRASLTNPYFDQQETSAGANPEASDKAEDEIQADSAQNVENDDGLANTGGVEVDAAGEDIAPDQNAEAVEYSADPGAISGDEATGAEPGTLLVTDTEEVGEPDAAQDQNDEPEGMVAKPTQNLVWDDQPDSPVQLNAADPSDSETRKKPLKRVIRKPRKDLIDE